MQFLFLNERDAPDVSQQPEVDLHHWRLYCAADGAVHLSAEIAPGTMRITTPVLALDVASASCVTFSGRRYRLCCAPEAGELLRALLQANAERRLIDPVDVSDRVWEDIASRSQAILHPDVR